MTQTLPPRPHPDWLRKSAKQKLRSLRLTQPATKLAQAQHQLAREYGFPSWRALIAQVEDMRRASVAAADALDEPRVAQFLRAVGAGRIEEIRAMLQASPALVDAIGPHPYWGGRLQALHLAVEGGRREAFDLLLAAAADVDGRNEGYMHWSPLMLAIYQRQAEMQKILLARGARVGLTEALLLGDDARVERLLREGASALPTYAPNGGSLLALARTPFALDRLLELGVSAEQPDRWGATPIEAISRLGTSGQPLLRHLLARGFSARPEDYARLGDRERLATLLAARPELARDPTLLLGAVDFGHRELARWLLERGADPNARSQIGSQGTALHSAAWNGDLALATLLVEAGADVQARDPEHDNTPSGWARVSAEVTNNPRCLAVAEYLEGLQGGAPALS